MHALVVFAHPDRTTSFSCAVLESVTAGLSEAGHEVDVIDLYALEFTAAMSASERRGYDRTAVDPPDDLAEHLALIRRTDALVFVFPTWWSGLPAILKGWLERVMVPGLAFDLDPDSGKVTPALHHVDHIVGVTTYGSPRWYVRLLGDPGRRTLLRVMWLNCGVRTKRHWLPLYGIDTSTPADRAAFLSRVQNHMASALR